MKSAQQHCRDELKSFLISENCQLIIHRHRGYSCFTKIFLIDHLLAVFDILVNAGCDKHVCIAAGLHSIYGTNIFNKIAIIPSPENRNRISAIFSIESENLAYLFHIIDRPHCLERFQLKNLFKNRITSQEFQISYHDIHNLLLIEASNLIDQSPFNQLIKRFPNIMNFWKRQLRVNNLKSAIIKKPCNNDAKLFMNLKIYFQLKKN